MRVLVTGGAGFIGSALVERLLAEGHQVDVVDDLSRGSLANLSEARSAGAMSFHRLDLRSPELSELFARRRPEVVFHLASRGARGDERPEPLLDAEVNVVGSLNLLEACRTAGVAKVVFSSSATALYGAVPNEEQPIRETQGPRPRSGFAVAKRAVGDYLSSYRELFDLEFTILALSHVYGPRQDPAGEGGVVVAFAAALLAGQACTVMGDWRQERDFLYLDDAVDALARALEKGGGLLLNIGSGVGTAVGDLHARLGRLLGIHRPPVRAPAPPTDVPAAVFDPGKASIHLGWRPWTGLDAGLEALIGHLAG